MRWVASVVLAAGLLCGTDAAAAAIGVFTVDGDGVVRSAAASRASMQRTPPATVPADPSIRHRDPDALRYGFAAPLDQLPSTVGLRSVAEDGTALAQLVDVPLETIPCPAAVARAGSSCAVTPPIRAVADDVDSRHPLVASRSLLVQLGGAINIDAGEQSVAAVRVAGPRQTTAGSIERLRAKLRFIVVLPPAGGDASQQDDAADVEAVAQRALAQSNALWGACGVSFGTAAEVIAQPPPPPHLLSIGCEHGLPAGGGAVRFRAGGKLIEVVTDAGMLPAEVARRVAMVLESRGFRVALSDNQRMSAGAGASTDLSVRDGRGALVSLARPRRGVLSTDPTLGVCIGQVNLDDGLQHFSDIDAVVGTLEERTLLKALPPRDPSTIDVVLISSFARGGRLGESFIGADHGSIRNVVVVERAGAVGHQASYVLAHERGHVLLDDPGHPDDYGVDTPTFLMDGDAVDPTAFGPRRLSHDECARVKRQSGRGAPNPLLAPWPLEAME